MSSLATLVSALLVFSFLTATGVFPLAAVGEFNRDARLFLTAGARSEADCESKPCVLLECAVSF